RKATAPPNALSRSHSARVRVCFQRVISRGSFAPRADPVQALRRQRGCECAERVGYDAVVRPGAATRGLDEARLAQHLQMVRNRGLREVERCGQVADARLLRLRETIDDRDAGWISKCA